MSSLALAIVSAYVPLGNSFSWRATVSAGGQPFQAGHSLNRITALSHGFQQAIQVMIGPVASRCLVQVHQCSHHPLENIFESIVHVLRDGLHQCQGSAC